MSSKSVLEHFTVPDDFQNGNTFKGKCMHCGTLISGSYKVTSNFVTHMKRKHRDLYILHSENKEIQPTLTQCIKKSVKYSPSDPKQLEMTNALIMFIAGDLLPLSIVESEEFKNLMEKADTKYQVPSRKHLSSKLLHEKSVEIKNNLVNTLKRAESVCLTIDLWSSRQMRGFLGITGHFILDWAMKSVMICCKRFKGRHTAESIRSEYEEVVTSFEIGFKIAAIVSDNASNMVKAFSIPGFDDFKVDHESSDEEIDDVDKEIEDDQSDDLHLSDCLPKHSRCFAHTLQLVVKDGLMAKLAVQYLAIPATSAPVERLFSTAGKTFRPERCRLADGTFEKLMMVKCNGKMLK